MGVALTVVVLAALSACVGENQATPPAGGSQGAITRGGDERTGPYEVVEGWWKAAANHNDEWSWGQVAGVAVDNPDRIVVVGADPSKLLGRRLLLR